MPTNAREWLQLALVAATGGSAGFAVLCLVALARRRWCMAAMSCVAVSFAATVAYDYWRNSVDTFPVGPFPRQQGFYPTHPLVALATLVGGIVDLSRFRKRGAPNPVASPDQPREG